MAENVKRELHVGGVSSKGQAACMLCETAELALCTVFKATGQSELAEQENAMHNDRTLSHSLLISVTNNILFKVLWNHPYRNVIG